MSIYLNQQGPLGYNDYADMQLLTKTELNNHYKEQYKMWMKLKIIY